MNKIEAYYQTHARIYDLTRRFFLFGRHQLVDKMLGLPGNFLLDVGCGTGFGFKRYVDSGIHLTGVDISPEMLAVAQRKCQKLGIAESVRFVEGSYGREVGFKGSFDKITFSYSLSMIPDYQRVLDYACENMKPGGVIGVLDIFDSTLGFMKKWFAWHSVQLGPARFQYLDSLFERLEYSEKNYGLWEIYLYIGRK